MGRTREGRLRPRAPARRHGHGARAGGGLSACPEPPAALPAGPARVCCPVCARPHPALGTAGEAERRGRAGGLEQAPGRSRGTRSVRAASGRAARGWATAAPAAGWGFGSDLGPAAHSTGRAGLTHAPPPGDVEPPQGAPTVPLPTARPPRPCWASAVPVTQTRSQPVSQERHRVGRCLDRAGSSRAGGDSPAGAGRLCGRPGEDWGHFAATRRRRH